MPVVPAIKGKIGSIEYYQCTMSAMDLISRTQNATEYFSKEDWEEMGPWGQNQRDVDPRYLKKITPYLLRDKNRFFNSFLVLLDTSKCSFKSIGDQPVDVKGNLSRFKDGVSDYSVKENVDRVGFLTILDQGAMCILDGQHRMRAIRAAITDSDKDKLKKVLKNEGEEDLLNSDNGVKDDLYSVIFVAAPSREIERKIFTDINTYAKPIGKKELIALSETNGYYKVSQNLAKEDLPFNSRLMYMQSTSLPDAAAAITTLHHMSVMIEKICVAHDIKWNKEKKQPKENIAEGEALAKNILGEIFSNIDAYKYVINKFEKEFKSSKDKPKFIAELRKKNDSRKWGLLFKPLPQLALLEAILFLKSSDGGDLDKKQIYNAINNIDWSYDKGSQFQNMVITPESNILTGSKILERLKNMILYWILGEDKFKNIVGEKNFDELNNDYNSVNELENQKLPKAKTK